MPKLHFAIEFRFVRPEDVGENDTVVDLGALGKLSDFERGCAQRALEHGREAVQLRAGAERLRRLGHPRTAAEMEKVAEGRAGAARTDERTVLVRRRLVP